MPPTKKTEWLSPQNLIAILGFFGMAFTSYTAFREGTASQIADLKFRLSAAEKMADRNDARLDAHDKAGVEILLRLDRLERGKR